MVPRLFSPWRGACNIDNPMLHADRPLLPCFFLSTYNSGRRKQACGKCIEIQLGQTYLQTEISCIFRVFYSRERHRGALLHALNIDSPQDPIHRRTLSDALVCHSFQPCNCDHGQRSDVPQGQSHRRKNAWWMVRSNRQHRRFSSHRGRDSDNLTVPRSHPPFECQHARIPEKRRDVRGVSRSVCVSHCLETDQNVCRSISSLVRRR